MKLVNRLTQRSRAMSLSALAAFALILAGCSEISSTATTGTGAGTGTAANGTVAAGPNGTTPVNAAAQPTSNIGGVNIGTAEAPAFTSANAEPSAVLNPQAQANVPPTVIDQFYRTLGVSLVWGTGDGSGQWLPGASQVVDILKKSYAHGLQPNAYLPSGLEIKPHSPETDRALTAGLIKYISDVRFGRTRSALSQSAFLAVEAVKSPDLPGAIAKLEPQDFFYQRIHKAAVNSLAARGAAAPNFQSLETTMEKLRTIGGPSVSIGRKVLVNIGAFDLQAWDNGRIELTSRVIVGQEGRLSPIGPDSITNLKFSPDWNAPRSIIEKDLYPKLVKNPEQFKRFGLRVLLNDRIVIDPSEMNWAGIAPSQIHVKQIPGPWNVLGGVRFTLSNSQSVYLHDTSDEGPYANFERADSSGCIRVEKAADLSAWILEKDGQPIAREDLAARMDKGDINYVYLRNRMPVEMVYYTAWVDGSGALQLVRDIYQRDTDWVNRIRSAG